MSTGCFLLTVGVEILGSSCFRGTQLPKTMWELVASYCRTLCPVLIACSPSQFR